MFQAEFEEATPDVIQQSVKRDENFQIIWLKTSTAK